MEAHLRSPTSESHLTGLSHQQGLRVRLSALPGHSALSSVHCLHSFGVSQSHSSQDEDKAGVTGVWRLDPAELELLEQLKGNGKKTWVGAK